MLGVDRSFALLTPDDAASRMAHAINVFAQCLWDGAKQPANRVINLRNALNGGMRIVAYTSPSISGPDAAQMARMGVPDDIWAALEHVACDIEEANAGADYVACLNGIAALGKPKDLYTNYDTYVNLLGNPAWPDPACGLWNADWDGDITNLLPMPFADLQPGDPRIWGKQYLQGTDEDLDVFLLAPIEEPAKVVDGVGLHFTDGSTVQVWPVEAGSHIVLRPGTYAYDPAKLPEAMRGMTFSGASP